MVFYLDQLLKVKKHDLDSNLILYIFINMMSLSKYSTHIEMKRIYLTPVFLLIIHLCYAQNNSLLDPRDGQSYSTVTIRNMIWMTDNLNYATNYSVPLSKENEKEYEKFDLRGRYYHFQELDSVCPAGWRLPSVQDWQNYFEFLVKDLPEIELQIQEFDEPNHYITFMNYDGKIDLFENGNPLHLNPTGRIEGEIFNVPDVYADYWTKDPDETYAGKSHAHIMNVWTTIHSHKHNLKPGQKKKLRKFMVRCITDSE